MLAMMDDNDADDRTEQTFFGARLIQATKIARNNAREA